LLVSLNHSLIAHQSIVGLHHCLTAVAAAAGADA